MKTLIAAVFAMVLGFVSAQEQKQVTATTGLLSEGDLDVLLGPIALYPDPLLADVLAAATEPGDIVLAVRFLNAGGDPAQIDAQRWMDSARALAHYPELLRWLDENLDWTTQVGKAFIAQPEDVMSAIQRLREIAWSLGNLLSNSEQVVERDDGAIDILPANPDVVYVPVYDPITVYRETAPVALPARVQYRPGARSGIWLRHDWDWSNRRVVIWTRQSFRPATWWKSPRAERVKSATACRDWAPRKTAAEAKFWATRRQAVQVKHVGK